MKYPSIKRNIFHSMLILLVLAGCNRKNDGITPSIKPLMEAVYASGFVVSKDEHEITAQAEGYVTGKLVQEGDVVKKGEPLYLLESGQSSARHRMARETFELAEKNYRDGSPVLGELKAAMKSAHAKMLFDSANFIRYSNLMQSQATSRSDYDRAKLTYENSANEHTLQKSRYEKLKNQLYLEWQNAKNNLVIASDEAGKYIVRSFVDGMIFRTTKEKGEMIRRSEVVAVVGKKDAYYLELDVDELDVQKIRKGQEAFVKIDAYPGKTFNAVISRIYPMVDRRQQAVRVDAELIEELPGWFSGLALEANIVIQKKERAIVIPKTALLPGDSVMIRTEGGEKKIKVTRGIETLDEVEIIEGLDAGKLVVINK